MSEKNYREFKLPLATLIINSDFDRQIGMHVIEYDAYEQLLTEARKLRELVPLAVNGLSTGAKMILENFDAKYPNEENKF